MPRVSAIVITFNEASNVRECLASLAWADEVIVVDSGSTDGTADLARIAGARVIVRDWSGYAAQKDFAASQATHDWILSVDADERVTPELAAEIRRALEQPSDRVGYRVPRITFHLGRWIRHTDWYPDYQLRLYDRRQASWAKRLVHESVTARGPVGQLSHDLQHYAYRDINHHYETMQRYTTLAASQMASEGRRAGLFSVLFHPPAAFLRNYVLKAGFLDGMPGLIISAMNAHYVFLKFAKLWALQVALTGVKKD
ncbi:MAG TPA: glycosyltransferase family 2 protein [Vicinamibacterales bacterium]|nr:glycosyltransferase family 2 protein [Vicinamibacterales bacterium]